MSEVGKTGRPKVEEVNLAVRELLAHFRISRHSRCLHVAIITYGENATVRVYPTPVRFVDESCDFNPLRAHSDLAAMGVALEASYEVARQFLNVRTGWPRIVKIIVLSDGRQNSGVCPELVANRIAEETRDVGLFCVKFGEDSDSDDELLRKVAGGLSCYLSGFDLRNVRKFFLRI